MLMIQSAEVRSGREKGWKVNPQATPHGTMAAAFIGGSTSSPLPHICRPQSLNRSGDAVHRESGYDTLLPGLLLVRRAVIYRAMTGSYDKLLCQKLRRDARVAVGIKGRSTPLESYRVSMGRIIKQPRPFHYLFPTSIR